MSTVAPPVEGPAPESLCIAAGDGFTLAASCFPSARRDGEGEGEARPRPVVLVAPATGVVRRLYGPFAAFLATRGLEVVTWDWRGTGESRPRSLRGFAATMTDWARHDLGGVLAWAGQRYADRPLLAVGHSFGGQALGLAPGAAALRAAVTVAAQSGYWGHWPRPRRYLYALLWYVGMPAAAALLGYFPSRRLGLGEDLPQGVARQWARWCRNPGYLGDWHGHHAFAAPILALAFTDDPFAPPAAVAALHREYRAAPLEHRLLAPRSLGVARIGHFGFFEPELGALWAEVADWLDARAAGPPIAAFAATGGSRRSLQAPIG